MKQHDESFQYFFRKMTSVWVAMSIALLAVFLFLWGDKITVMKLAHFSDLIVLKKISALGGNKLCIAILSVLFLALYGLKRRKAAIRVAWLWTCVFVPSMIGLVLKIGLGRARPSLFLNDGIYGFKWLEFTRPYWSFPSGHTTATMGLVFGLWILFPKYRWWFVLIGGVIPLSRIILTQHFFSDVMVTAYLTLLEVGVIYYIWQRLEMRYPRLSIHG